MAQDATRSGDIFNRAIELIDPDPDNSRDIDSATARADIEEIAQSILMRGFDPDRAILVRKTGPRWIVTDGHKRRRAYIRAVELGADLNGIPCRSEAQGTDEADRAVLRLRAPGRELTPLEAVIDIKRLIGWGWGIDKIAAKLGKKSDWIDRCLELAGAPIEVRQAVRDNQISPTEARRMVKEHGSKAGGVIAKAVEHARTERRERARPRDIAAVTKPRTEPPSLASLVSAAVNAWENGADLNGTMATLRDHPLVVALRGQRKAA